MSAGYEKMSYQNLLTFEWQGIIIVSYFLLYEVKEMKNSFKKIITSVLAIAVLGSSVFTLFSCKGNGLDVPKFSDDTIKIGASGPLTGGAAVYGLAVQNCAKLAISEINEKGGLNGIKFSFEMFDDQHDATRVNTGYANLYENGMQISLGTVTTKPGLEWKELSKDDNVFVLTPSASGDDIPEYSNAFQMCFADSNQGTASAEYFNDNYQGKKIGVFYKSDDEYSTGIYAKFKAALDSGFGQIKEASFKGEESDFATQVAALKDCDVIFMPIYYTPASQFMIAGKNVVKADAVYYGCDGLDGIDAIAGFDINTITQEVSYLSHFNSNATTGAAADFIAKYNETFDEEKEPLNQFGAAAYDCIYAIYYALLAATEAGETIDGSTSASDLCDILTAAFAGDYEFNGVTGEAEANGKSVISWSANGFVNKKAEKYVVKKATAN